MTYEQMAEKGEEWAQILMLKKSPDYVDRYLTAWGDKTALGVFLVINRLVAEKEE